MPNMDRWIYESLRARAPLIAVVVLSIAIFAGVLPSLNRRAERAWQADMMKEGNRLVEKIEQWKAINGRLPSNLSEAGLPDDGPLYYNKWSDDEYVVSYADGRGFFTDTRYYSKNKKWSPLGD